MSVDVRRSLMGRKSSLRGIVCCPCRRLGRGLLSPFGGAAGLSHFVGPRLKILAGTGLPVRVQWPRGDG